MTSADLDADAFSYSGSQLLQFGYTNANAEQYYLAYVVNVTIDSPWAVVDNATVAKLVTATLRLPTVAT